MDDRFVGLAIGMIWLAWLVYWWRSARDVKRTGRQESARNQLTYRLPLVLGMLCLAAPGWIPRALAPALRAAGCVGRGAGAGAAGMAETFPEYAEYRRHPAALIPGIY